jgi:hypothetical protein
LKKLQIVQNPFINNIVGKEIQPVFLTYSEENIKNNQVSEIIKVVFKD